MPSIDGTETDNWRPRIAITGPDRGGILFWWLTAFAVWRAGGRPVRVRPCRPRRTESFDGLVIGGGADVDPALYAKGPRFRDLQRASQVTRRRHGIIGTLIAVVLYVARIIFRRRAVTSALDPDRDELELHHLRQCLEHGRPVLGICRGAQLINVACGGSLHGDLHRFYVEYEPVRTIFPRKLVTVAPDSRLADHLGRRRVCVNALHRQAVARVGRDLRVVAQERAGVPQAIESTTHRFIVGVQWHPELLPQVEAQRRLFKGLVEACRLTRTDSGTDTIDVRDMTRSVRESFNHPRPT